MAGNSLRLTGELPDEIAMDIFLKLPVKSLIRFQCVSKSLSTAVRSPKFIAAHHSLQKRIPNPRIRLQMPTNFRGRNPYFTTLSAEFLPTENIRMPFLDQYCLHPYVDGPCNGLLCINDDCRIALWNPATREFKQIPLSTIRRPSERETTEFGPVGFGFDSRSGEYKVIRFITNYINNGLSWIDQVELYCLSSNSWREIAAPEELVHGGPTFRDWENGLCHWSATGCDGPLILSFDMRNESFNRAELPEFGGDYLWNFVKHPDGAMAVIAYPREGEEKFFDLWVKKERWIKELRLGPFPGVIRPLGASKNGQLFLESSDGELLLLDVESGEMKNFGVSTFSGKMHFIMFAGSLVPIHGRTEHQENIVREMIRQ